MNIITGIVTYNRKDYLRKIIESYFSTIDLNNKHTLIIADDNSQDGSKEYLNSLKNDNVNIIILNNDRRGVHHQVNQILKKSSTLNFDVGFMSEDDVYFIKNGWDTLYGDAVNLSRYEHLCYFSPVWAKKYRSAGICSNRPLIIANKKIQSCIANGYESFGCFWTFTKNVINKVGYFDLNNFGLWGNAHTDYTMRCCNAGFNVYKNVFDAIGSQEYIVMQEENYQSAISEAEKNVARDCQIHPNHRSNILQNNRRVYIPYNEMPYNMNGEKI